MREVRRNGSFHRYLMLKMAEQIHHSASTSISLIGFMGAGKTTIGRLLAERLGWRFLDLDEVIEQAEGRSIAEIFQRDGETHFRNLESTHLQDILLKNPTHTVIATGGGTPCFGENMRLLLKHTRCSYLEVTMDICISRINQQNITRPLASIAMEKLFEVRAPQYNLAQYRFCCFQSPKLIVSDIISKITT
jgi:shikimate kinase